MSSHFARLKEEFDAKQQELQEQQQTVESIKKITEELEAKKQALAAKAAELDGRQKDVKKMQSRIDALLAAEPAVDAAMRTKSSTIDLVQHVLGEAISGDHMSGSEIFQTLLNTIVKINGRSRADNLDDFLINLIQSDESLEAAIVATMASMLGANKVVKLALLNRVKAGENAAGLMESVAHTVYTVLGDKATTVEPNKDTNPIVNLPKENMPLASESQATPGSKNAPSGGQSQSTPGNTNGLRGQAKDFKPQTNQNGSYNSGGWEAFARENGVGNGSANGGGKEWVFYGGGWGSNSGRGH